MDDIRPTQHFSCGSPDQVKQIGSAKAAFTYADFDKQSRLKFLTLTSALSANSLPPGQCVCAELPASALLRRQSAEDHAGQDRDRAARCTAYPGPWRIWRSTAATRYEHEVPGSQRSKCRPC